MDDEPICSICGTFFSTMETLRKHEAAIHKRSDGAAAVGAKRARVHAEPEAPPPSEHVELAPLLGVLSDAQKDALLLRAVQARPEIYEHILAQASTPLTEEAADSRLSALDAEGVIAAVRWFVTIGVPANAFTLLVAASQRCLDALDALVDAQPTAAARSAAGATEAAATGKSKDDDDDDEDDGDGGAAAPREALLHAVEALPTGGAIGALWVELLARHGVHQLVANLGDAEADGLRLMLEGLHAAAATVRGVAPALLVGPAGETVTQIGEACACLEQALAGDGGGGASAAAAPAPGTNKARRAESVAAS